MNPRSFLVLGWLIVLIPLAHAGEPSAPRDVAGSSSESAALEAIALSDCGLVFATNVRFQARLLGDGRLEVRWREAKREMKAELRYECGPVPFETRLREAGLTLDGRDNAGHPGRFVKLGRASWHGVAAVSFHQVICRSVVGQAARGE